MRAWIVLILATFLPLGSCAKFPASGSESNATRISFVFTTATPIDPDYIYVVAIRVLDPPVGTYNTGLSDPTQGPSPVVGTTSKNGIVGGLPTHYIIWSAPNIYRVYRFFLNQPGELPDPNDPAPINLALPGQYLGQVLPGTGMDPTQGIPNQLGFTIDTSYLNQHSGNLPINTIQFNILTMNVAATGSSGQRVMDAIGNQSNPLGNTFNNPIKVSLLTSTTIYDFNSSVPEQINDTYPNGSSLPAVDLTSWTVTVTRP